jgi:regulator of RNase E activity RraA
MTPINQITRPDPALVSALRAIGTAKISSVIARLGKSAIRNIHMVGPVSQKPGSLIAGPALTLQFMPKREDMFGDDEYAHPENQMHRQVLHQTEPGDVVVVDARADMRSAVFGEMMMCYFKGRGGEGMVIDGCLRDYPQIRELDVSVWVRGFTPNFHTQLELMPFAVNVPIACGGVLVMPGDIIVADDDGAVCVPASRAAEVAAKGSTWQDWTDFSRIRLLEGGDLRRYYPLSDDARSEFEAWKRAQKS